MVNAIVSLIKKAACAICDKEPGKPAGYPVYQIGWDELATNLKGLGLELMLKAEFMPDRLVKYTGEKAWAEIIPFLIYPADDYVAEVADCDDYSRWAAADASRIFKLNGCLQCWGDTPSGRHAWGLVITGPKSYLLFEPNAGFPYAGKLFAEGDNGYEPKYWK